MPTTVAAPDAARRAGHPMAVRALLLAVGAAILLGLAPVAGAATPQPIGSFARDGHLLGIDVSYWQGKMLAALTVQRNR